MKKLLALLVVGFMVLSLFPSAALAVAEPVDVTEDEAIERVMTPDSPFYFLKRVSESVRTLLTFRASSRISLRQRLADERVKEYLYLQEKYGDQELNDQEVVLLNQALDDVVVYYMNLVQVIDDPGDEIIYDDDDGIVEDDEDEEGLDDDEEAEAGQAGDKYDVRIAQLEQILTKVPEAAHKGLGRAIENARRQQERFAQRAQRETDAEDDDDDDYDDNDDDDGIVADDDDLNIENQPDEGKGNQGNKKEEKVKDNGKDKVSPSQAIRDKIINLLNPGKGRK